MPRPEYVTLVDGAETLVLAGPAVVCHDWSAIFGVGPSRGGNRVVPGVPGTASRRRVRDELAVELELRCHGHYATGGASVPHDEARRQVLRHIAAVRDFLDGASDRTLAVRLTTPDGTSPDVLCQFEAMGAVRWPTPWIAEFSVLLTVPSGVVPVPSP